MGVVGGVVGDALVGELDGGEECEVRTLNTGRRGWCWRGVWLGGRMLGLKRSGGREGLWEGGDGFVVRGVKVEGEVRESK